MKETLKNILNKLRNFFSNLFSKKERGISINKIGSRDTDPNKNVEPLITNNTIFVKYKGIKYAVVDRISKTKVLLENKSITLPGGKGHLQKIAKIKDLVIA